MKKLFLLVCMAALLFSCHKEEPKPSDPTQKDDYPSLKIGNYWVYQCYRVDTLSSEELLNRTDSVIVKCDTTIRNNKYYVLEKFRGNSSHSYFLRDSSGYLVSEGGVICFSATNFTDILFEDEFIENGTLYYTRTFKMEKVDNQVTVPAGKYDKVLNYKGTVVEYPNSSNSKIQEMNTLYANNVGKILYEERWLGGNFWHEYRLLRYHIQQVIY